MNQLEIEEEKTHECDHCGGQSFGLVVYEGFAVAARCQLCNTLEIFQNTEADR